MTGVEAGIFSFVVRQPSQVMFTGAGLIAVKIAGKKRCEHFVVGTVVGGIEILDRLTDPPPQLHSHAQLLTRFTNSRFLGRFARQGAAPGQKSPGLRYNDRYIIMVFDHYISGRPVGVTDAGFGYTECYGIAHTCILDRPGPIS